MNDELLWQTKLHARLHDPAEKALVLLRDPAGHEGGTSRALHRLLGFTELPAGRIDPESGEVLHAVVFKDGIPRHIYDIVRRADWWAAAADRPQWPMEEVVVGNGRAMKVADWAQVRWTNETVLIHPLTGEEHDLGKSGGLGDTDIRDIKQRSLDHFSRLASAIGERDGSRDWRKLLLTFWRFGPDLREEEDFGKLGLLWRLLPADTRVPDHTIWDHLDLVSAFAGAFQQDPDGEAALLVIAIGPVQSFIEAARTTSDLWAGSHLLSRLTWETMKPIVEQLGPDAILFPRLRGVPQVDLWLRDEHELPEALFSDCEWRRSATDSNPLFSAALPNRFVALVPRSQAKALAQACEQNVRAYLQGLGRRVVDRLLDVAQLTTGADQHCHAQMREQLQGFPEMQWASVPFSLVQPRSADKQVHLDTTELAAAMAPFFGEAEGEACGFLSSPAWRVLQQDVDLGSGRVFFSPNPGVLYPAVYELAERLLAAAKSVRNFDQAMQTGWRCSLTGETEWLTTDPKQLETSYRRQTNTLWAAVAKKRPAWAKQGEHLGALPAIKRLWPTLLAEEVGHALQQDVGRFVVSTHAMALAHQLDAWIERGATTAPGFKHCIEKSKPEPAALPGKLARNRADPQVVLDAKRLPALLDLADDLEDESEADSIRDVVRKTLVGSEGRLETYYALLLFDGDHMGRWLSGGDEFGISYLDSFHPRVRTGFQRLAADNAFLRTYGAQRRAVSPNRHLAISGALFDFSQTVVRHVIEEEHLGRVIYAGGDDLMAMLPVTDLLPAMQRVRSAYSGTDPAHVSGDLGSGLKLQSGLATLARGRSRQLMRMMGTKATASCGAIIAHHKAPLAAVLRELRASEQRAKNEGGRDAFSLTVIKRSGGTLRITEKWGMPLKVLVRLRDFLADPGVSRRAVFNAAEWLTDSPEPSGDGAMLRAMLAYQMKRQASKPAADAHDVPGLAHGLTELALRRPEEPRQHLLAFMSVAEFLAREVRATVRTAAVNAASETRA